MILDRIVKVKQQEVERLHETLHLTRAEREIRQMPETKGFAAALRQTSDPVALIAEVKKASPSKGVIRADFDPVSIALQYETAGASAVSVLTDVEFFQGKPVFLPQIRDVVNLPLLRKDFIIDEYQIYEARLLGADAILLIAGLLSAGQIKRYRELARDLGMDSLVEAHDRRELDKAIAAGATLIGINNRDLHTFEVDLRTTVELAKELPNGTLLVAESGIFNFEDIRFVQQAGADAVLVGESLMRSEDVGAAVDRLMGRKKLEA